MIELATSHWKFVRNMLKKKIKKVNLLNMIKYIIICYNPQHFFFKIV